MSKYTIYITPDTFQNIKETIIYYFALVGTTVGAFMAVYAVN